MEKFITNELSLKPREKLVKLGADALSDQELLAILLGTGTKGHSVYKIAESILPIIDSKNGSLLPDDLLNIKGLGQAKSCTLAAALEFTRRRIRPLGVKIKSPKDILPLISHIANRPQEHFITISLNGAHEVIATRVITIGLVNSSQIHPREVFSSAITDRATAIIIAHNHPSGNLLPSEEDRKVTTRLSQSGDLLGIKVLDHIIFSLNNYYSFQENNTI
jgi:DNA repair protein RadC